MRTHFILTAFDSPSVLTDDQEEEGEDAKAIQTS